MFSCKFSVYLQNTFFWEYLWRAAYISIKLEQYKTIEPIYVLNNSLSCIDLLFTSQTDLIVKSRVHYNLHWNCHHQILFAKNNQQIFYPRLYFGRFGSIKLQILILSWVQSQISTGKEHLLALILTRKLQFSVKLFLTFPVTLFCMIASVLHGYLT